MSTGGNKTRLPASYAEALVVVSQLEKREVELLQRALGAETTVERLEGRLKAVEQDRDAWRGRWERAQAQVGRWFKVHGEAATQTSALREEVSKLETERDSALEQAVRVPGLMTELEVAHAFHKVACAERDAAVKALLLTKLAGDA